MWRWPRSLGRGRVPRCGQGDMGVCMCGCVLSCTTRPPVTLSTPPLPACNVTIHNRCKDTANCTKVKQKVRWQGGQRAGGEGSECVVPCLFRSFLTVCSPTPLLSTGQPDPPLLGLRPRQRGASLFLWTHPLGTGLSHPDALSDQASFLPEGPATQLLSLAHVR